MGQNVAEVLLRRALVGVRPSSREELRGWVRAVLGVDVPAGGICAGHGGPMDYLEHAFFEDELHSEDVVVWANRGGGKTFYGAVATMLDLIFKPGVQVRILGGSLDQSRKMHEYLRRMLEAKGVSQLLKGKMTKRSAELVNGSSVELLCQSETSVRGQRVQKLRCDELELFDPEVWRACQFVTQSKRCGEVETRGTVEAFSTMHRPFGLMAKVLNEAAEAEAREEDAERAWEVIRWCALDVMGPCEEERVCKRCALLSECKGNAKYVDGFMKVGDVLSQKRRSSREAYMSEMLCARPSRSDSVFGRFDLEVHVRAVGAEDRLTWVGGMDFGIRSPFVMLWAQLRPVNLAGGREGYRVEVVDEYVRAGLSLDEHLRRMDGRGWPRVSWVGVDPAGHQRCLQSGLSTVGALRQRGYAVRARAAPLREGLEVVRRRLDERGETADGGEAGEGPLLVIDPRCEKLIEAMTCYHFDAQRNWSEQPVKDGYDHPVDALRYLLLHLEKRDEKVEVRRY